MAAPTTKPESPGPADLPVIGEPFAVELANTLYRRDAGALDFLGTPALVRMWFDRASSARPIRVPRPLEVTDVAELGALRDAVRELLTTAMIGTDPPSDAIEIVNRQARRGVAHLRLRHAGAGALDARLAHEGTAADVFLATVADRCIDFLAGGQVASVRRCERPDCPMLFVRCHGRRRFCHDGCSHRLRQARYRSAPRRSARPGPRP